MASGGNRTPVMPSWLFLWWAMAHVAPKSQCHLQKELWRISKTRRRSWTQYRSVAMRAAYLAQNRPDLQVATRSLAQRLQQPTTSPMLMLKRVARYLRYRPRMAQFFPHQSKLSPCLMWSDADHTGCVKTRKSVSGGVLMSGACCIKSY